MYFYFETPSTNSVPTSFTTHVIKGCVVGNVKGASYWWTAFKLTAILCRINAFLFETSNWCVTLPAVTVICMFPSFENTFVANSESAWRANTVSYITNDFIRRTFMFSFTNHLKNQTNRGWAIQTNPTGRPLLTIVETENYWLLFRKHRVVFLIYF